MSTMKKLREFWSEYRAFYVAVGVSPDLVNEGDRLVDAADLLYADAPGEVMAAWRDLIGRLNSAAKEFVSRPDVSTNVDAINAAKGAMAFALAQDARRLAEVDEYLATNRGAQYLAFARWAYAALDDQEQFNGLVLELPRAPRVTRAVVQALGAPLSETRVMALADTILTMVETYYRPVLEVVWRVSARIRGLAEPLQPPTTTGNLMAGITNCWNAIAGAVRADDVIYYPANEVRIGAGHPGNMKYETGTRELVLTLRGVSQRLTESDLRERHDQAFRRARTMHFALLRVAGLEQAVLTAEGRVRNEEGTPASSDSSGGT